MIIQQADKFLIPQWPAPASVRAAITTQQVGNLADYVGDVSASVLANRRQLQQDLKLPQPPCWLNQVHGSDVIDLSNSYEGTLTADASYTHLVGQVCAVLTADCLPIFICNQQGTEIAAIHAGWRGLLAGVIDNAIHCFKTKPADLFAWLGPAIGPDHFEVNAEIRHNYKTRHEDFAAGFIQIEQRWFADLYYLAKINLQHCGVTAVFGGGLCTYCEANRFYSYRRDQGSTGRLASLIWLTDPLVIPPPHSIK